MTVEASKVVAYGLIGPDGGLSVSKVVAYVLMQPGDEAPLPPGELVRQVHVHTNIIKRS